MRQHIIFVLLAVFFLSTCVYCAETSPGSEPVLVPPVTSSVVVTATQAQVSVPTGGVPLPIFFVSTIGILIAFSGALFVLPFKVWFDYFSALTWLESLVKAPGRLLWLYVMVWSLFLDAQGFPCWPFPSGYVAKFKGPEVWYGWHIWSIYVNLALPSLYLVVFGAMKTFLLSPQLGNSFLLLLLENGLLCLILLFELGRYPRATQWLEDQVSLYPILSLFVG